MKSKIFCIGFQKTGTTSMRDALRALGYTVADYFGSEMEFAYLRDNVTQIALARATEYDAVQDMPWPLLFRELDAAFPGAKFVLTERNTESWIASMVKHFRNKPSSVRQLTYGEEYAYPEGNEARYIEVYEQHNAAVRTYFADRPSDLLIMNLENGDGWKELGAFLGLKDIPTGDFVHANKAEMRDSLGYRVKILATRVVNRIKRIV